MKIRDKILEAAITLFAQHGYTACTTKQIAHRARVAENSVFRLFGSKTKLFEEVIKAKLVPCILEAAHALDNLPPKEMMERISVMITSYVGDQTSLRLRYWTGLEDVIGGKAKRTLEEAQTAWITSVRKYVVKNREYFRHDLLPETIAMCLVAPLFYHHTVFHLFDGEEVIGRKSGELLSQYSETTLCGLLSTSKPKVCKEGTA